MVLAAALALGIGAASAVVAEVKLVMVEQPGCAYCAAWDDQIAPAYDKTAEGQFAPLIRADLQMGPPEGVTYARRVNFTPTFILIDDGVEIARMEGYVGEDFFWPVYAKLLEENTDFEPALN
ncbi:thioredoxin fold domain-containing protein [Primorskyibacter sp. 2E107]|uniref:thioredoxin fold domain-containing protein n=1 Tax=Primorskyibacter sp. 2E107 TaxID=3403458 RepID=UPI003AF4D005